MWYFLSIRCLLSLANKIRVGENSTRSLHSVRNSNKGFKSHTQLLPLARPSFPEWPPGWWWSIQCGRLPHWSQQLWKGHRFNGRCSCYEVLVLLPSFMNYFVWERELDMSKYSEDNQGNYRIQLAKKPKQKAKKLNFGTKWKFSWYGWKYVMNYVSMNTCSLVAVVSIIGLQARVEQFQMEQKPSEMFL